MEDIDTAIINAISLVSKEKGDYNISYSLYRATTKAWFTKPVDVIKIDITLSRELE